MSIPTEALTILDNQAMEMRLIRIFIKSNWSAVSRLSKQDREELLARCKELDYKAIRKLIAGKYWDKNIEQLRNIARNLKLTKYHRLSRAQLIKEIENASNTVEGSGTAEQVSPST